MTNDIKEKGYFQQYWLYSSALRNWLVAYGIGACALFLTDTADIFKCTTEKKRLAIVVAFLSGVAAQIFLTFITKIMQWYLYAGEDSEDIKSTYRYKVWAWISERFWIDVVIDIFTFAAFAYGTYRLICLL